MVVVHEDPGEAKDTKRTWPVWDSTTVRLQHIGGLGLSRLCSWGSSP